MTENNELTRADIAVGHDVDLDADEGRELLVYVETWFDVDKKFHIKTASADGAWLNMYARFNPFEDDLRIECEICFDDHSSYFDYEPTSAEAQLIKELITERIREDCDQTPQEFCEEYYGKNPTIGEIQ